tara:strand:+ start:870 stop:1769 length:900 start_codon:yes stop_codon:yes gene_type:complete
MINKIKKEEPKFYISKEDWKKIIAYAESSYHQFKSEIGGQLIVIEDEEGDYILKAPVILKQTVSAGNCTMEEEALAVHYSKMIGEYGNKARHCWWHSHHTMKAFWSGTDDATILSNRVQDWSLSLVVNLKEEYKLRVQFFSPIEHDEDVTLHFLQDDVPRDEALDSEVKSLCKTEIAAIPAYNNSNVYNQTDIWDDKYSGYNRESLNYYGTNKTIDLSLIPKDKEIEIFGLLESCQDKVTDGDATYKEFLNIKESINKAINKYNLVMIDIPEKSLISTMTHLWPEDLITNINGGINLAN